MWNVSGWKDVCRRVLLCASFCAVLSAGFSHLTSVPSAAQDEVTPAMFWKSLDTSEKDLYLTGMLDGMRVLCTLETCQDDIQSYIQHYNIPCIMKIFDSIYDKNMPIYITDLLGITLKKCNGELNENEFILNVKSFTYK